jgi:hypothetical protein
MPSLSTSYSIMKLFHCKFIIKLGNEVAGWQDGTYYVAVSTGPDNSIISISLLARGELIHAAAAVAAERKLKRVRPAICSLYV